MNEFENTILFNAARLYNGQLVVSGVKAKGKSFVELFQNNGVEKGSESIDYR